MFAKFKIAALSAVIALGSLAAMPAQAQAQNGSIYLGFGQGAPAVGLHFNDRGMHHVRDRHHHRPGYHAGRCSPREATRKASRMGLRHARVVHANHRVVRVEGRGYGHRFDRVTFANARGCPVIR